MLVRKNKLCVRLTRRLIVEIDTLGTSYRGRSPPPLQAHLARTVSGETRGITQPFFTAPSRNIGPSRHSSTVIVDRADLDASGNLRGVVRVNTRHLARSSANIAVWLQSPQQFAVSKIVARSTKLNCLSNSTVSNHGGYRLPEHFTTIPRA
jgi:hypothetical protein